MSVGELRGETIMLADLIGTSSLVAGMVLLVVAAVVLGILSERQINEGR